MQATPVYRTVNVKQIDIVAGADSARSAIVRLLCERAVVRIEQAGEEADVSACAACERHPDWYIG